MPRKSTNKDTKGPKESDIKAAQKDLPNLAQDASLPQVREALVNVPTDAKIEAIARALLLKPSEDLERRIRTQNLRRNFLMELDSAILNLDTVATTLKDKCHAGLRLLANLSDISKQHERSTIITGRNRLVSMFDGLSKEFAEQYTAIVSFLKNIEVYQEYTKELRESLQTKNLMEKAEEDLELLAQHTEAFLRGFDAIEVHMREFPSFCGKLAEHVNAAIRHITAIFSDDEDLSDNSRIFRQFLAQEKIPVYKNNIYLTYYLYELALEIPSPTDSNETASKFTRNMDYLQYISHLKANSDPGVNNSIRSVHVFTSLCDNLVALESVLREAALLFKTCKIAEIRRDERLNVAARYNDLHDASIQEMLGGQNGLELFRQYNTQPLIDLLKNSDTNLQENKSELEKSQSNLSRRDINYLALFEKLDELVIGVIKGRVGNPEFETFFTETADLLRSIRNNKKSPGIKKAKLVGNHRYTISSDSLFGQIVLERLPSAESNPDDLIGRSWLTALEKVVDVRNCIQLGNFYQYLSPRGQINNNMLIVGPYGSGKNLFLRQVLSDPKIVGISLATDQIESMWHGQTERNVRTIFELAHKKRQELEKPAIIGWDEFDCLFSRNSEAHVAAKAQKTLQTVLQGEIQYDGVGLIALTNEPDKIPMSVWRRFANVVIIEPFTCEERKQLILHLLSALPLTPDFARDINWDNFLKNTTDASGDVIGKIFDAIFLDYRNQIADTFGPRKLMDLDQAASKLTELPTITQADRCEIFEKQVPDLKVTPQLFEQVSSRVLSQADVVNSMKRQAKFYHELEKKLNDSVLED